jgi:hypothetical protein
MCQQCNLNYFNEQKATILCPFSFDFDWLRLDLFEFDPTWFEFKSVSGGKFEPRSPGPPQLCINRQHWNKSPSAIESGSLPPLGTPPAIQTSQYTNPIHPVVNIFDFLAQAPESGRDRCGRSVSVSNLHLHLDGRLCGDHWRCCQVQDFGPQDSSWEL